MTLNKVKIQEEIKVYCALKWTATQTFVLFLIVHLIDFVWSYSKRCSEACAWLCLLSSGKDGCVKRKWFHCCTHTTPDYLETHEDFSSCTFVRELQLCFSLFCSVKTTLKHMSRMRGMYAIIAFPILSEWSGLMHSFKKALIIVKKLQVCLCDCYTYHFVFMARVDFFSAFRHWWAVDCRVPRPLWPLQRRCWGPLAQVLLLHWARSNCGGCGTLSSTPSQTPSPR